MELNVYSHQKCNSTVDDCKHSLIFGTALAKFWMAQVRIVASSAQGQENVRQYSAR